MGKNADWVIKWIGRMARKYGATVWDKDGRWWDWGQALCREQYGREWMKTVPDEPTDDDVLRAFQWEKKNIPSWVDQERMTLVSRLSKEE